MDKSSLAHMCWNCTYHIVFAPKYRRQMTYGKMKRGFGGITRGL
nr:transposase [Paenibacillus antibioticophila]